MNQKESRVNRIPTISFVAVHMVNELGRSGRRESLSVSYMGVRGYIRICTPTGSGRTSCDGNYRDAAE